MLPLALVKNIFTFSEDINCKNSYGSLNFCKNSYVSFNFCNNSYKSFNFCKNSYKSFNFCKNSYESFNFCTDFLRDEYISYYLGVDRIEEAS